MTELDALSALYRSGRFADVILQGEVLRLSHPNTVLLYNLLGGAYLQSKRPEKAEQCFQTAVRLQPISASAHNNLGIVQRQLGKADAAVASFRRAVKADAKYADAYTNMGAALFDLGQLLEAVDSCNRAIKLKSDSVDAHYNLGLALRDLKRDQEAAASFTRVIALQPRHADAYVGLGYVLTQLDRFDEAVGVFERAIELNPNYTEAYNLLAAALKKLGRRTDALECYNRALAVDPDLPVVRVNKMHQQAHICDWRSYEADAKVIPSLGVDGAAVSPFAMLLREDNPARHRIRAERFSQEMYRTDAKVVSPPAIKPTRLRIGYFSADFHNHATMWLIAKLFETHDRTRFMLHAYSYGPDRKDSVRARAAQAFDVFRDVRPLNNQAIAAEAAHDGLDIAIDLKGYTEDHRSGIFARRAAPVQISFLGFPGTTGAPFMDYLIADKIIVPPEQRAHYSESILYLPNTYQVNDDTRAIAEPTPTRSDLGLPESGFVFCCFNNTFKITPREFDIWMRLLTNVPGSVLWLLAPNPWAEGNLRREAQTRGVDPSRLVFAPVVPPPEHLARCRVADLFLDTFDCNAHTTASDALWAGLPVLTKPGQGLVARVAASLLTAINLPELIASDEQAYEALALELATNPEKLQHIRAKLAANRTTSSLFDTARFARNIERAYEQAYDRYFNGLQPADIVIEEPPL